MDQAADRQPLFEPLQNLVLRLVSRWSAHVETFAITSSRLGRLIADPDFAVREKCVRRQIQVFRRGPLTDAAGAVILRAVAGAEPAVIVAFVRQRNAAEMRANADDHEPLFVALLDAL